MARFGNRRMDHSGYENDDYVIVGDTGRSKNGQQIVVAMNKHSGEYEEHLAQVIKCGLANGRSKREAMSQNNPFVGARHFKDKWASEITIGANKFHLGVFNSQKEAHAAYQHALKEWIKDGKKPEKVAPHAQSNNKSGELYIHFVAGRKKCWVFEKTTKGESVRSSFEKLDDAIKFKHKYLGGN